MVESGKTCNEFGDGTRSYRNLPASVCHDWALLIMTKTQSQHIRTAVAAWVEAGKRVVR